MRLAILGAGSIGTTIGRRWQKAGHDVVYGVRDPHSDRYKELAKEAAVEGISQALSNADATLLAIPGDAVANLLDVHRESLDGALLLDTTNALSDGRFHRLPLFEARVPDAHVYRAFNTLGWENFADPLIDGERPDLFFSGPEGDLRTTVERLIADVGLRPVYVGAGSDAADLLDGITRLWFTLALRRGHGRHLAFRTLGLPTDS